MVNRFMTTMNSNIKMVALGNKRQITALLSVSKSGHLLPPQLIYAGKTIGIPV
jgi:hypothetical protein